MDIADGDNTPSTADHTDFGSITLGDAPVVRTFTIQNNGDELLNVTGINLTGTGAAAFMLGALDPPSPVAPFEFAEFTVTFDPATAASFNASVSIANDDLDENPYTFAITGTAASPAPAGAALAFDGTNDYVEVSDSPSLNSYTTTGEFTLEYWVKAASASTPISDIISKRPSANNAYFVVEVLGGIGYHYIHTSSGFKELSTPLTANAWQHVALTAKAGGAMKLYLNGALAAETSLAGVTFTPTSAVLRLMADTRAIQYYYPGSLDEVRLWNVERTCEEIKQLYNCEFASPEPGMMAYYKFNQGVASGNNAGLTTLTDATANGNNGTLINFGLTGGNSNWVAPGGVTSGNSCVLPIVFPEINPKGNGASIADGDTSPSATDHTDFGETCELGSTLERIFTIKNEGTDTLIIPTNGITITGAFSSDFTFSGIVLPDSIPPGDSVLVTVTFDPSTSGALAATLNIASNDCDENPYNFIIQGTGTAANTYYEDLDNDGFGNAAVSQMACTAPTGYVSNSTDCNDANAAVNPDATELCNGVDDDCANGIDDGLAFQDYYLDTDGDNFGAGAAVNACQPPGANYVLVNGDCNDANAAIFPGAAELCDGLDNDCDGTNDDGLVFQNYYLDGDGDNFGAGAAVNACQPPVGSYVLVNGDCDDANAAIFPGAAELCDGLDNDCDGTNDDGLVFQNYYLDGDGDNFGAGAAVNACQPPVGSYVLVNGDCDDANPNINPSASELCNSIDDDCANGIDDGLVFQNYYLDGDGDNFGASAAVNACQPPVGSYVLVNGDCNDSNVTIFPGATELCDGLDNDCDGTNDDGLVFQNYYLDGDGDSFGAGAAVNDCQPPVGSYVLVNGDCNDANPAVFPGATELCDGLDNDCDGTNDDGIVFQNYYLDGDGDNFGAGAAVNDCQSPGSNYVLVNGDCNDANAAIFPGAMELCDGLDNDCDGTNDDGIVFQDYYLNGDGDNFGAGAAVNACQPPGSNYVLVNGDCNDANAAIFPGAMELCDGLDNDCVNGIDDGLTFQNYYLDSDGDNFGAGAAVNACLSPGSNYLLVNGDCNDANAAIFPGATELCDGLDNDCANGVDDGLTFQDYYLDNDGDSFGTGAAVNACQPPVGSYVLVNGDCNDSNAAIFPGAAELCDGLDNDCANGIDDGLTFQNYYLDSDGDNFGAGAAVNACQSPGSNYVLVNGDCNDANAAIFPGAMELCDGLDNDCDGTNDDGIVFQDYYLDGDGDNFGAGAAVNACQPPVGNYVLVNGDCDDANAAIFPGATELCDGLDNDCDGTNDDGIVFQNYYLDGDGDNFGAGAAVNACQSPGSNYVLVNGDCNDANAAIFPGAMELCDGLDNDCDGTNDDGIVFQDYYLDGDGDNFGAGAAVNACQPPVGSYVLVNGDCNDSNAAIFPGATELCDGLDNDCDGTNDDGIVFQDYYLDGDGDNFGAGAAVNACQPPVGIYVLVNGDCDDANSNINPSVTEICNNIDDDCDGDIDETGAAATWYADADADGFGNPAVSQTACNQPTGFVANDDDCNDANSQINPTATEVCNGVDDDCDNFTDTTDPNLLDTTLPTVNCKNHAVVLGASGTANIAPNDVFLNGSDNCGSVNLVSVLPNTFNCSNIGNNTVTLTVNDGQGNQNTCSATVSVSSDLTANAGNDAAICNGQSTTLGASGTGGSGSYSYAWSPGQGLSQTNIPNPIASPNTATTYTVLVTDANGCTASDAVVISVNAAPVASISTNSPVCQGGDILLSEIGGSTGVTWAWSGPNGFVSNLQSPTVANATTTNSGTYTVIVTAGNNCTASATANMVVYLSPVGNAGLDTAICLGDTVQLMATGGAGNIPNGYQWSPSATLSAPFAANPSAFPTSTTTYIVTVTDGNNCTDTDQVTVIVNPLPSIGGVTAACDASLLFYTVNLTASSTQVTASAGTVVNNGGGSWTVNDVPAGQNIVITSINSGTNCEASLTVVAPNCNCPAVNAPIAATPDVEICANEPIPTLNVTVGAGDTADWYDAATGGTLLAQNTTSYTPVAAGNFYAETRVTASGCLSAVRTKLTLTIHQNPNANAGSMISSCAGATVQLDGSGSSSVNGGLSFSWSPSGSLNDPTLVNPLATPSATTIYQLIVTDAEGCTDEAQVGIIIIPVSPPVAGQNQTLCQGASIPALTVTVGTGETADWYDAATGGTLLAQGTTNYTPVAAGIFYAQTRVIAGGCISPSRTPATLTLNPAPTASVAGATAICEGESTPLDASASTGLALLSFAWDNGLASSSNPIATPAASTSYTVTVTDGNGCTATASTTVDVNAKPTIAAGQTACDASLLTYSFGVSLTGGDQLATSPGTVSGSGTSYTVTVPSGQDVTLTATNSATTCFSELTVTGLDCACPTVNAPVSNGDETICQGEPTPSLSVSVGGNETADWYATATGGTAIASGTTSYLPSQNTAGDYTFYVETRNTTSGCTSTNRTPISLIINTLPTASITGDNAICASETATLTATGGTGFLWNTTESSASIDVSPTASASYSVTVTDGNGCEDDAVFSVAVNALPTASITGDDAICASETAILTATGGTGFLWNTTETSASIDVSPTASTSYSVTVTDGNGCTDDAVFSVAVNALPTASITGDNAICASETATLTATGGTTFLWSTTETSASIDVSPTVSASYSVTVTDGNGCEDMESFNVAVNALPTASITGDDAICASEQTTLTATGGTGFVWNTTETSANIDVSPMASASYSVTVTDVNGCEDTESFSVIVNALPTASITGDDAICASETATLTATGGTVFLWNTTETSASIDVSPTVSASYSVTVTDGNGCTDMESFSVAVNALPTASITGDAALCASETATLTATGGTVFLWNTTETSASVDVSPTATASYSVTVTDGNGCEDDAVFSVTVNALPTASITGDNAICASETATLTATGGTGFLWSTTESSASVDVSPTATASYSVTVTDGNGCEDDAVFSVMVNALPTANAGADASFCSNSNGAQLDASGSAGAAPLGFVWSNAVTLDDANSDTPLASPAADAVYVVTVTDANSCTGSDTVAVALRDAPAVEMSSNSPICTNEDLELTESGGDAVAWLWTAANGLTFTDSSVTVARAVVVEGDYSLVITDVNGCRDTADFAVNFSDGVAFEANFLTGNVACEGDTVHFIEISDTTAIPGGFADAFAWDFGDGTTSTERDPAHVYAAAGTYMVSVLVTETGCENLSIAKEINVNDCRPTGGESGLAYYNLYPNITSGKFKLELELMERGLLRLELADMSGRVVRSLTRRDLLRFEEEFDLVAPGVYFLKVRTLQGSKTLKVVVVRA
ncbi:MAG: choice-of-anchor D domain-containing protein [Saprospiraceae bacterium]|nr:choice-of-anchor D domain-containing protein [Saprospiraceae bacterium]